MVIEQIKKRNGTIVAFDRTKIERAMAKAFRATQTLEPSGALHSLAEEVILELENNFTEKIPSVEGIQDIVERKLAEAGYFEVAKAYIIYRKQRAEAREEEKIKILERIEQSALKVKKRDGKIVRFNVLEMEDAIQNSAKEFSSFSVDITGIIQDCKVGIYDGISTSEINQVVLMAIKARIEQDPIYAQIAARFLVNDLYKDVLGVDDAHPDFEKLYREKFIAGLQHGVQDQRLDARLAQVD